MLHHHQRKMHSKAGTATGCGSGQHLREGATVLSELLAIPTGLLPVLAVLLAAVPLRRLHTTRRKTLTRLRAIGLEAP